MIVHDGLRPCEFCWSDDPHSAGDELEFRTTHEAHLWLSRLRFQGTGFVLALRSLLASHFPAGGHRLTDYQVLEETAQLLFTGRLVITCPPEEFLESLGPQPPQTAAPFPLPANPPPPASTTKPPDTQPPTFSNVNAAA